MAKNEHILFQDIPLGSKNGTFHSAVLTTYAIDLIHFDCYLRNILHRKQITSINILVDSSQLDKAVECVNPQFLTHIGKEYCVSSIKANGAFHPKINFFVGYNSVLVLIGSGNLTVTGQGKNHEVFTGFMIDADNDLHRPLIEECWEYILSFKGQFCDFERRRLLAEIPDNCNLLKKDFSHKHHVLHNVADNLKAALLYPEKGNSILSQIAAIIPGEKVTKISVLSPYYDEDGATLLNLLALCRRAKMDVIIQKNCSLPPYKLQEDPRINFFDFAETKRGRQEQRGFRGYERLAHAKIYFFETEKTKYCIVGSANATKSGLGTMGRRGVNDEFCVLYVSDQIDFLSELELKVAKRHKLTIADFTPHIRIAESRPSNNVIQLIGAWYASGEVIISHKTLMPDCSTIIFDNGEEIYSFDSFETKDCISKVKISVGRLSWICYVNDINGKCISNKVFLNRIDELDTTNPSPAVRELNRFVYRIESEGFNGLEVVDMLSDVMSQLIEDSNSIYTNSNSVHASMVRRPKDTSLPNIKYDPSLDNDETSTSSAFQHGRASKLIECIEESIRRKVQTMEDDLKDEEEEADSESSNKRVSTIDASISLKKTEVHYCEDQAFSILQKYLNLITKRKQYCQMKHRSISADDLCFFSLAMFASTEICYLNRFLYDFTSSNRREESHYKKLLFESLDRVMEHEALECLIEFSKFCSRLYRDKSCDESFTKAAKRAMKYALLYVMFFFRFASSRDFNEKKVKESMELLINIFGMPDRVYLEEGYKPLIEKYNHVFEFRYIEQTLYKLGFSIPDSCDSLSVK